MSQLTDFIHRLQRDWQGGLNYGTAAAIIADIKAEKAVLDADAAALAAYINTNAAVEEGILTALITVAPVLGIPAAGVAVLNGVLLAIKAMVAAGQINSDAYQELMKGFETLNKAWATRVQTVLSALGVNL